MLLTRMSPMSLQEGGSCLHLAAFYGYLAGVTYLLQVAGESLLKLVTKVCVLFLDAVIEFVCVDNLEGACVCRRDGRVCILLVKRVIYK
jgi:hypothetical protein